MTVRIVTDSTADLDPAVARERGIVVVPLHVHFGSEAFTDGVSLGKEEFYRRLPESDVLPRTSQPSPGEFRDAYQTLQGATAVVSIHLGGKLSGTVNAARAGAALCHGGPPVEVVDSDQASMALGFAVLAAAQAAAAGADATAVAQAARRTARRARVVLFVDTLEYLQKGGRIGRARAFLGTLLRTKPVLELREGEIEGIARPRTRQRALDTLFDLILRTPQPERIAVLFCSTPEEAEAFAQRLREALPRLPIEVVRCSPVIGVHTGPGAIGAAILRREA